VTFIDRVLGRQPARKAVMGGPYLAALQSGPLLSVLGASYQEKAAAYLRAYKTSWFYKAESRISRDFANLTWTLSYEDSEGDNAEEIVAPANNVPFASLDPLEQFLRLSERPNPYQTGRQLKQQSQIRLDMTGRALIYLEGGDGGGLPTAMYGISPSRMWPSHNAKGELVGWVLDRNSPSGGTPFSADEIVAIEYAGIDDPVGVIEAIYAQVPLTDLIARHVGDVLTTGGRLAGMISPKNRSLDEDEYQDVLRAWRNVSSDPNAGRRLLVFPEPMDWTSGASTPTELGIPELSALTRDEILTAFPISPYMLGIPQPHGLASGEIRREERHDYWEATQHPRVEIWEDAIQQQLIPRYEAAVGRPLDMDIEEPNLDDAETLTIKATAYQSLVAIGFDAKESVGAVGLSHIKWNGLPASLDPVEKQKRADQMAAQLAGGAPGQTPEQGGDTGPQPPQNGPGRPQPPQTPPAAPAPAKARTLEQRAEVMDAELRGLHEAVHAALIDQRGRLIPLIEASLPKSKSARMKALPDDWWDPKRERSAFLKALQTAYLRLTRGALEVVSNNVGRVVTPTTVRPIMAKLLESAGLRIDDINETTRSAIVDTLTEGTRRGYSISQLVHGVPDEAFSGLHELKLANGGPAWDTLRAETIARTETMLAYNEAALRGYGEFQVKQVTAIDGDEDDQCAARDGRTYALDEALAISDHPNGTLDWVPVVDKAAKLPEPQPLTVHVAPVINLNLPDYSDALKAVAERPAPPITVNTPAITNQVDVPAVNVTNEVQTPQVINEVVSPQVNVTNEVTSPAVTVHNDVATPDVKVVNEVVSPAVNVTNEVRTPDVTVVNEVVSPSVHVAAPNVTIEPQLTVSQPARKKLVKRDEKGQIVSIEDGD
jgi:phage portal protein BeeE